MDKLSLIERKLSYNQRKKLRDSQFGIPELRAYPLNDPSHVEQAVRMFNHVDSKYESELANNIKKAIKRFNLDIEVGDTNRFKKYYKEQTMNNYSKVTDEILSGKSIHEALCVDEADNFNENNAVFKVRDWLTRFTYNYEITNVEIQGVKIDFAEIDPDGSKSYSSFTVKSDGHIYNENGEDVVTAAFDANDNDLDIQREIKDFAAKWYK